MFLPKSVNFCLTPQDNAVSFYIINSIELNPLATVTWLFPPIKLIQYVKLFSYNRYGPRVRILVGTQAILNEGFSAFSTVHRGIY
jgi:hypothetical protein